MSYLPEDKTQGASLRSFACDNARHRQLQLSHKCNILSPKSSDTSMLFCFEISTVLVMNIVRVIKGTDIIRRKNRLDGSF